MTNLRTAAQQALEAMESAEVDPHSSDAIHKAITALKAALAEPVQEPVAWKDKTYESLHHQDFGNSIPLYTAPPQRKPLDDLAIADIYTKWDATPGTSMADFARAIERAHGITS